jgi:hypothetical protein
MCLATKKDEDSGSAMYVLERHIVIGMKDLIHNCINFILFKMMYLY